MTSPRQARARERLLAMLAIGFCLGALATTYLGWRRDVLRGGGAESVRGGGAESVRGGGAESVRGGGASAPQSSPPPMVPGPTESDVAAPTEAEIIRTAPAIGPPTTTRDTPPPSTATGTDLEILQRKRLRIPVDGVAHAALQPSFDQARGTGRHEAIDILAPRGTPVHAVDAGVVGKLFSSVRGGITVYQYDPSGTYCYYYAHLDRYAPGLREGQTLRAGDLVGYVGVSGNAPKDTPHLHFAIFRLTQPGRWWEGTAIDPYLALR